MENLELTPESKNQIIGYTADNHLMPYEADIFKETLTL